MFNEVMADLPNKVARVEVLRSECNIHVSDTANSPIRNWDAWGVESAPTSEGYKLGLDHDSLREEAVFSASESKYGAKTEERHEDHVV